MKGNKRTRLGLNYKRLDRVKRGNETDLEQEEERWKYRQEEAARWKEGG